MNRSALCIQMLHILYGRIKPISKEELAFLLETNPRNIVEFKKELEIAGYVIESTSGKYGGYLLKEDSVFPSLALTSKEKKSLNEALDYLKAQNNFIYYDTFESVINKVKAKHINAQAKSEAIYINDTKSTLNELENKMLSYIIQAKDRCHMLQFEYRSNYGDQFLIRHVQPYEIIVSSEGIYLLAYDLTAKKEHNYKYFKVIAERMKDVIQLPQTFQKDTTFKMQDHIGKNTLMKDVFEVELEISGIHARLVNEKKLDNVIKKTLKNDILYITFMMEGKMRLKSFILSLGKDCKVIAPQALKEEIALEIDAMQTRYK